MVFSHIRNGNAGSIQIRIGGNSPIEHPKNPRYWGPRSLTNAPRESLSRTAWFSPASSVEIIPFCFGKNLSYPVIPLSVEKKSWWDPFDLYFIVRSLELIRSFWASYVIGKPSRELFLALQFVFIIAREVQKLIIQRKGFMNGRYVYEIKLDDLLFGGLAK